MPKAPDSTDHFDVLVVGGGPSGLAAALTLRQRDDLSVLVVERSDYSSYRVGESLSPGARPLLEYLGVWDSFLAQNRRESFGNRAAWGSEKVSELSFLFTVQGHGWSVDRSAFDRMLADELMARGGQVRLSTRMTRCEEIGDEHWSVDLVSKHHGATRIQARYLIDSSGRHSSVARAAGSIRVEHDQQVGIVRVGTSNPQQPLDSVMEVEACAYGWWYTCPLPNGRFVCVLMTDADIAARQGLSEVSHWNSHLQDTVNTRARITGVQFETQPKVFSANSSYLNPVGGKSWVAIGDAAAAHDPLSSSGIPHALGSGVHGAIVAADSLANKGQMLDSYQESTRLDVSQYLKTRSQVYSREQRWPSAPFWKRRTDSIQLNPNATILSSAPSPEIQSIHLQARHANRLKAHCIVGRKAFTAVRAFSTEHPQIPDERIILALQELSEHGSVALTQM